MAVDALTRREPDNRRHYTYREFALGFAITRMWVDEETIITGRYRTRRAETYTDTEPEDL